MCSDVVIAADGVSKIYAVFDSPLDRLKQGIFRGRRQFYHEFTALRDVSFSVHKGDTLGIVGRNGSGKSTLLQLLCGTLTPTAGAVHVNGTISALLELGTGFNPNFTGKENIYLNAAILGLSKKETTERYDAITAFADIGAYINQPVKTYSSGMVVRLAFAVAVAVEPDILIVDEALAVGDEAFQRKCFARIEQMQARGCTILFVSHSPRMVLELCDSALLLDQGELLYRGAPKAVISEYQKLIYAPEEKRAALREALKEAVEEEKHEAAAEAPEAVAPAPEAKDDAYFDPHLVPQSTVEYAANGAEIAAPRITERNSGKEVNVLKRGERYCYQYEVMFHEAAEKVRFGMMLKTKSGVVLGGTGSSSFDKTIPQIAAGSRVQVRFTFACLLTEGSYFTNAGCSAEKDGERQQLHRILDAYMFYVMPEGDIRQAGPVDFLTEPEIEVEAA